MTMLEAHELAGHYVLDPAHSRIGFVARHAMVTKIRGHFTSFEGDAYVDLVDPARSRAQVVIHAESIDTGNAQRDGHLRTGDFLDAPGHPVITFESTKTEALSEDTFRVSGLLTIKGVTREVSINFVFGGAVTDPLGNTRIGFEGTTTVNRRDWGVAWNAPLEAGGVLVSEKVTLEIEVSAIKAAATQ
jgi:polyisoprenoid-binding protein YceI